MGDTDLASQEVQLTNKDWESIIREITHKRAEVIDIIDRGYLRYQGKHFVLSKVDRVSILLTNILCNHGGQLILNYPIPYFRALTVLALEAMYAHPARDERPYVICITHDPWHREEYMNLQFDDYITPFYKMCFPFGMLRADGTIRNLSNSSKANFSSRPHLIFAQNATLPNKLGKATSTLIAEIDYRTTPENLVKIETWAEENGVPSSLFVVTDPLSLPAKKLYQKGYPIWSWDRKSLGSNIGLCSPPEANETLYPFSVPDDWIQTVAKGQEYMIVTVKDEKVGPKLLKAREYTCELRNTAIKCENAEVVNIANASLGALHALEDLPVPVSFYDHEAVTVWGAVPIRNRLGSLERIVTSLRNEDPHATGFLTSIIAQLNDVYAQMESDHSGKPAVIIETINLAIEKRSPLGILVKNNVSKQALNLFLVSKGYNESDLSKRGIYVLSTKELEIPSYTGPLLFTFIPRYNNRTLILYPSSHRLAFLVYPGERPAIEYMLRIELQDLDHLATLDKRIDVLNRIGALSKVEVKSILSKTNQEKSMPRKVTFLGDQDATVVDFEKESILHGIIGDELIMPDLGDNDNYVPISDRDDEKEEKVDALAISLESGRTLLIRPSSYVTTYKVSTQKINDTTSRKLTPGNYIVLVHESITRGLLEVILERVHHHPKMTYIVVYQSVWIDALRRGMSRCADTPETLLEKLKAHGSKVSVPLTIRLWQRGIVIGPHDPEDIRRIGRIYEESILIEQTDKINSAIERVRKIHRQLAHRLRHLIKKAGVDLESTKDDELIVDEELGLYLDDFSDAVSIEKVISINGSYKVESRLLNKVFEGEVWKERIK